MRAPVYLVLLHHPIQNRNGQLVTTAVTNLDIHDIARSSRTYGVKEYFLVTPIEIQHELVGRILSHWQSESSRKYHPDRFEALSLVKMMRTFEEVRDAIAEKHGEAPEVVLTDARLLPKTVSYVDYRREISEPNRTRPVLLVFGTGWGVAETFYPVVDRILAPVYGPEGSEGYVSYNHLSVRAAVAVILDRLLGT